MHSLMSSKNLCKEYSLSSNKTSRMSLGVTQVMSNIIWELQLAEKLTTVKSDSQFYPTLHI